MRYNSLLMTRNYLLLNMIYSCPGAGCCIVFFVVIYRTSWDTMPSDIELKLEPVPSDGVVLTNKFRTMRLKQPTIELIYVDGKLNAIESGVLVPVADGV